MKLLNSKTHFGIIAILFHWITLAFLLVLYPIGYVMTDMAISPDKLELYSWHKSIGFILLILVILRLSWRIISSPPPLPNSNPLLYRAIALTIHLLLSVCLIVLPISGWLMSSAAGFKVVVFRTFELPDLIHTSDVLRIILQEIHFIIGIVMLSLISAHIFAFLYHQFYKRDNIINRILPFFRNPSR